MKFTEILEELKKGEKVTREKWEKPGDSCAIDFIMYDQKKDKCEFYRDGKYYDEFVWVYEDIIAEDWKIYEEKPTRIWKPEFGEKYYYITTSGDVAYNTFNTSLDEYRLSFRNVFKTAEEARKMVKKIKIINKLRELSNINFNDDCKKEHYVISYNNESKKIVCDVYHLYVKELPFNVYFATQKDCENAVKEIGEDNLKKYYFDVED
nr:MAG TPA: Protein of unknown function (DUF2829) [Caudoviricetes sp.]